MATRFRRLNDGWNAEPNAPNERVVLEGGDRLVLEFLLNPWMHPTFGTGARASLIFSGCRRYRFTAVNDEGWFRGQCRFSKLAPAWGEFYEVSGDLLDEQVAEPWITVPSAPGVRVNRYLFYLRDLTFECDAANWHLDAKTRDGRPFSAGDGIRSS